MTPDTPVLLARYNAHANSEMNKIISTLSPEEWDRDFQGYFKSVRALCSHVYIGDHNWMKRFKTHRTFSSLSAPLLDRTFSFQETLFGTVREYLDARKEFDGIITAFASELTAEDLSRPLQFTTSKGVPHTKNFGGLLTHMFNHQTHHRGMISLYLDMMGKPNDFSNLLFVI